MLLSLEVYQIKNKNIKIKFRVLFCQTNFKTKIYNFKHLLGIYKFN